MLTTVILKMGCKYFGFIDMWVIVSCFVKGHVKQHIYLKEKYRGL